MPHSSLLLERLPCSSNQCCRRGRWEGGTGLGAQQRDREREQGRGLFKDRMSKEGEGEADEQGSSP